MKFPPVPEQLDLIKRDALEIVPEEELVRKLERSLKSGEPLRINNLLKPEAIAAFTDWVDDVVAA